MDLPPRKVSSIAGKNSPFFMLPAAPEFGWQQNGDSLREGEFPPPLTKGSRFAMGLLNCVATLQLQQTQDPPYST